MTSLESITRGQYLPSGRKLVLLLVVAFSITGAVGALASREPMLAVAIAATAALGLLLLLWPDAPTLAVIFFLYTNAAVVAVQFHGLPFIVGAGLPALLILPLAHYFIIRRQNLRIDDVSLWIFLFLAVQLIGALSAVFPDEALNDVITFASEGFGIYFLILNTVRTPKLLRYAVWVIVIAGLLMGALSFYQQVTGTMGNNYAGFAQVSNAAFDTGELTLQGEVEQARLAGPLGQQNRYAQVMLMIVPLALFLFWGVTSKKLRLLAAASTAFILIGAALTFSRGAAVGFVLMLVVMAFMRYIKLHQLVLITLALFLVMQLFPQYGARLDSLPQLVGLVAPNGTSIEEADGSTRSRVTEMAAAALVFADHPIAGVGPGMYRHHYREYAEIVGIRIVGDTRQAHNLYLGLAAENGFLGLMTFGAIIYLTLRNLAVNRKRWLESRPELANIATGLILAIVVYLTTGLFLHFAYIRYFWLIMGLAGALNYMAVIASANTAAEERAVTPPQSVAP